MAHHGSSWFMLCFTLISSVICSFVTYSQFRSVRVQAHLPLLRDIRGLRRGDEGPSHRCATDLAWCLGTLQRAWHVAPMVHALQRQASSPLRSSGQPTTFKPTARDATFPVRRVAWGGGRRACCWHSF